MAKKNSRRSSSTTKPFKAIKNGTDKEIKAFLKWLEDQLADISDLPLEPAAAIADMTLFWFKESRVETFLGCCRDRLLFAPVYCSKFRELCDTGEYRQARPWVITFYIALHLKYQGQTPKKSHLADVLSWMVEYSDCIENGTADELMIYKEPLANAYRYAKQSRVSLVETANKFKLYEEPLANAYQYAKYSRVSLAHCLVTYLNVHEKPHNKPYFFGGPYVKVILLAKTDRLDHQNDVTINTSIQLKTLVMMFTNGGPIADHQLRVLVGTKPTEGVLISSDQFHNRIVDLSRYPEEKIVIEIRRKSDNLGSRKKPASQRQISPHTTNRTRRNPDPPEQVSQKNEGEHYVSALCEKPSKLKIRPSSSKKKNSRGNVDYNISNNDDRVKHSYRLGLIFEEAADIFKERRQRLNDLVIKKTAPKPKLLCKAETCVDEPEAVYHSCSLEGKAGKTCFLVLIGHEEYLYKSSKASKLSQVPPRSLDLHGCSRDEAIIKLSNSLSKWLDAAMKEHPYTLPVNIITGGGCQIISDTVEHWIRENRNVANRF
jgi:hypothetical protein